MYNMESEDIAQSLLELSQDQETEYRGDPEETDLGLLIEIIQNYEFLYNISDKRYKDHRLKARAWQEISEILKCSVESCQKAWKSLRDKFVKTRNKQKASGLCPTEHVWPYYEKMLFYSKFNKPRRIFKNTIVPTVTTVQSSASDSSRSSSAASLWSTLEPTLSPENEIAEITITEMTPVPSSSRTTRSKKGKASHIDRSMKEGESRRDVVLTSKKTYSLIEPSQPSSANEMFGKYVTARLDELGPEKSQIMRKKIMLLLHP